MNVPKLRFKEFNDEWKKSSLGDFFSISAGGDIDKSHVSNIRTEKYQYPIYANALTNNGLYGYSDIFKIDGNSITVTGRGDIGKGLARNGKYYPIVRLLVLKSNNEFNNIFFANAINNINLYQESTGVPQLTSPQLGNYKVFYPSISEQNKIGNTLELIDKKIELQSKKIENLKLFKICTSDKFFNIKSKETKKLLSNHCTLLTGKSKVNQFDENGIYYIMDMGTVNAEGYILKNKPTFCDLDMLSYGDLIMPKDDIGGGLIIGKTGFIDENNKYILGDHVYLIKTKNINSLYLHYQINSKYINKELKRKVTGSAQLGLKADNILNQEILVHSENSQNKIANIFELIDKKIKLENRKLEKLLEVKKGLMQSMFI